MYCCTESVNLDASFDIYKNMTFNIRVRSEFTYTADVVETFWMFWNRNIHSMFEFNYISSYVFIQSIFQYNVRQGIRTELKNWEKIIAYDEQYFEWNIYVSCNVVFFIKKFGFLCIHPIDSKSTEDDQEAFCLSFDETLKLSGSSWIYYKEENQLLKQADKTVNALA